MSAKHISQKGRVSLERALSKLGIASRTEARMLIESGKVKVHGSIEKNPARMVNPNTAHIELAGKKVIKETTRLIAMNKPVGVLTTKRDPEGRKTVFDLLPEEFQSFHAVGRLDQNTSGLLLFTNDTKLSSYLTDPQNKILRTYIVTVRGEFTAEKVKKALGGVKDGEDLLIAQEVKILKASGKESLIEISLNEGKNREIRRLCENLGNEVVKLKRISFGAYALNELPSGKIQEITHSIIPSF